jgi:hypothetical protein
MFALRLELITEEHSPLLGKLLALSANIRLSWRGLTGTNALAFYEYANLAHKAECSHSECRYAKWRCAEGRYAEGHYAEGRYTECRHSECHPTTCRFAQSHGARLGPT